MPEGIPDLITIDDLAPFASIADAKAAAMIEDAVTQALTVAPCLAEPLSPVQLGAVKGVLRAAILRWDEAGAGGKTTRMRSAGVFQESETLDTTNERRGIFWPSEIRALQAICKERPKPYGIDMGGGRNCAPSCARAFGATYCDCGCDLGMGPQ
jgi:hypothetical protein